MFLEADALAPGINVYTLLCLKSAERPDVFHDVQAVAGACPLPQRCCIDFHSTRL